MALNIEFSETLPEDLEVLAAANHRVLIVPVGSDGAFTLPKSISLSAKALESMENALEQTKFKDKEGKKISLKAGDTMSLVLPAGEAFRSVVFAGFQGKDKDARPSGVQAAEIGSKLFPALALEWAKVATLAITPEYLKSDMNRNADVARLVQGLALESYTFEDYKTKPKGPDSKPKLEKLLVVGADPASEEAYKPLKAQVEGVHLARRLGDMPPNHLHPESFANIIKDKFANTSVSVKVISFEELEAMGAGGIVAVGKGSDRKPCMVILERKGKNPKSKKPLAFVGKGVTHDSGGYSIKPGGSMVDMKLDMGGAAAVVGLMHTLEQRDSDEHVVGVVGLAENMISGGAFREGDIVKFLSGTTAAILNTDAEGRVILADCLTYVQNEYDPRAVVDIATLTGAMVVALGHEYTGVFSNDERLWKGIQSAGTFTGEKVWQMPLDDVWMKAVESDIADLQNMGKEGRIAGACVAAGFLEHLIDEGRPWAHLDVAGTFMVKGKATGVMVRTFDQMTHDL